MRGPPIPELLPRLGLVEATLVVMGGIVGSGIFINPSVVARHVHSPELILGAWVAGGAVALVGAFVYAELAERMPKVGGQYAYLREAFHPVVGFLYGWALLMVINAGGTAAVAMTFGRYAVELTGMPLEEKTVAVLTLVALAAINCLGVKSGSVVQGALMVLKIGVLLALIVLGLLLHRPPAPAASAGPDGLLAFGAAMVPVLFAYGGWQAANFVAAEVREPRRNLPRALVAGVIGVVVLYLGANWVYLRGLGPAGLAATGTPASTLMGAILGPRGATFIALGIAVSTLGFLSHSLLTMPRVYFAMASDGVFFSSVARVSERTRAPVVAIVLQAGLGIGVA
ncbi:MAG TPA: amino acid permease, partial [Myxococcaceae bacterium]|nr:amino acid permease [Myxococcaceae bacterium]